MIGSYGSCSIFTVSVTLIPLGIYIRSPAINPSDGPVLFSAGRLSKILVPEANLRLSVRLLILK